MSSTHGRTVRLFLVDGTASGLVTAEIVNWTGHVITAPRSGLANLLSRPELDRTGIYFLYGEEPENPDAALVYIGESDNVRTRLAHHNGDPTKSFWQRTCVVISKDQNITKAHGRYLESKFIEIAAQVDRATLHNGNAPLPVALPEADRSDMEYFIEQVRLVLPVLGFDFLRAVPKVNSAPNSFNEHRLEVANAGPIFELRSKKWDISAEAQEIDGEFIVFANSLALAEWKQTEYAGPTSYAKLHDKLLKSGKLVPTGRESIAAFKENTPFTSPSAASAVVLGRADNGRTSWRVKGTQTTYADWQSSQVEQLVARYSDIEAKELERNR